MWCAQYSYRLAPAVGHDTTIMPMLAAIGGGAYDGSWAPYASLMVLETYVRNGTDFLFRAVLNGEELVFPGCEQQGALCDVAALESALSWLDGALAQCKASHV